MASTVNSSTASDWSVVSDPAQSNGRLGDYTGGKNTSQNEQNTGSKMPAIGTFKSAWTNGSSGIWGSTIGSGLKSDAARSQARSQFGNGNDRADARGVLDLGDPHTVTGSSSLLSSSESEGWGVRRASTQWSGMAPSSFGNGLAGARNGQGSTSPVRSRPNQNTRSNSPYHSNRLPAIGASVSAKASQQSHLDPTSRAFNSSGMFNPLQGPGTNLRQNSSEAGTNFDSFTFGNLGTNGANTYSDYASSAASRSGSLPPSRHGNDDPTPQFGDAVANPLHMSKSDIFTHHRNQASRSSNFSTSGVPKMSGSNWGMGNDLSSGFGRLDLNKDSTDNYPVNWDNYQAASAGGMSGSYNNANYQRNGSLSYEGDPHLAMTYQQQYNKLSQLQYSDMSSQSPSGSEARRGHDSPFYASNTPPFQDHHHRAASTHSVRSASGIARNYNNFNNNPALLDYRLRQVQEAQQFSPMQQSPTLAYRQNGQPVYPYSGAMTPAAMARMNPAAYYPSMASMPPANQFQVNSMQQAQRMPPPGPARDIAGGDNLRSALMEEFRSSKGSRKYELKDIFEHVVEFSGDQHGSRFIQQKLETANSDEKAQLFKEILPNAWQLMTDVFGNYVIQKFFEHGNQTQKKQMADKMKGHIADLSLQMYGCRVVQKAFEHILTDQQAALVKELEPNVLNCIKDQNGNHVIQKAIQRIPPEHVVFINNTVSGNVYHLAAHSYGCRVIQRMLEFCPDQARNEVIEELHACALNLIVDQYGNYVIQNVMDHGRAEDRLKLIELTIEKVLVYSKHKYASNVVEHCFRTGTDEHRKKIVQIVRIVDHKGDPNLHQLVRDQYGNYVIQTIMRVLKGEELARFLQEVKLTLDRVRTQSYGKHIGQIDKLVEEKTREVKDSQSRQPSVHTSAAPTPPPLTEDSHSPQSSSQPSTTNTSTVDGPVNSPCAGGKQAASTVDVAGEDISASKTD